MHLIIVADLEVVNLNRERNKKIKKATIATYSLVEKCKYDLPIELTLNLSNAIVMAIMICAFEAWG